MHTAAILPVKGFDAAKQRLGDRVEQGQRSELMRAMLADVVAALTAVNELDEVLVVTANALAPELTGEPRVRVLYDHREDGQSAAAQLGLAEAGAAGFSRALLVPGDAPLLDPREVSALLARPEPLIIVPDRHETGTNALVLSPLDALEPSFGPGSLARHVAGAKATDLPYAVASVPSLALDVDTSDDLDALAGVLGAHPARAAATRATLRRLSLTA